MAAHIEHRASPAKGGIVFNLDARDGPGHTCHACLAQTLWRQKLQEGLDAIEQPLDLEDNELGTQGLYSDPASEQDGENTVGERFAVTHAPSGSPALKISAIAWSNDTSKRFAIVNLRSVHEGDSIEGALVHEIHEDGIVFKWQGDDYKILMSRH